MSEKYYLYVWSNNYNDKLYIGQTNNVKRRWYCHKSAAKRHREDPTLYNWPLYKSMAAHGFESFHMEVLREVDTIEEANQAEMELIEFFNSMIDQNGYNLRPGGDTVKPSAMTIRKRTEGINRFYKNNVSKRKGIKLTLEHRAAVSRGSMGKPGTNTGKVFSIEHSKNLSDSQIGVSKKNSRSAPIEIQKEICDKYLNFYTILQLHREYGPAKNTITDILIKNGIELRVDPRYAASKTNAKSLYTKEEEANLANKFRSSNLSIIKFCAENGLKETMFKNVLKRNKKEGE